MTVRRIGLVVALSVASAAHAREVAGVIVPDQIQVEGKPLKLNGMGVRKKMMFKVYVAALYLESPTGDAQAAIHADERKQVEMVVLRDLSRDQIARAVRDGIAGNAKASLPAISERLDRFAAALTDRKQGEHMSITYVPGKGILVASAVIEGKDFADALLSVWLGEHPADNDLKQALLGGAH
jgi:hypothetical protein